MRQKQNTNDVTGQAVNVDTIDSHWFSDFPDEPGFYWFYGDQYQGQMGSHYADNAPPIKKRMNLIEVFEISNGLTAKCDGQLFPTIKFNKVGRRSGYVGYFAKATLPKAPDDSLKLFG